ncbi:RagB/SusD family nutrient uptake outer membrane protein [Ancylomarina sp. 16SWW S1-10-2]|uniref:RagB/SusD family nutrient uptake outer membrane protein n=1 Tax=Ancylomarina sp. 16SWW S1-10-2 TaxID=2499681 RepID=UPI001E290349|nr:RagB/SusD family nutrient uptake outer membrane protein [Ancylomarina sp. 16SWW S1-10-2]
MIKYISKIAVLLILVVFTACEDSFLSPDPTGAITSESFFSDDSELEAGLINMYDGIQGINSTDTDDNHGVMYEFYVTEMRSDNTRTKGSEGEDAQFDTFTVEATNGRLADYYASCYNVIYRANLVLDKLDAASEGARGAFEGEAKFVRAYTYFNLVRLFGDVPLVDKEISVSDGEISYTRVATATIYDLIESDLQTAIANLDNSYKGRASKAAAQALLAKVYLTQGENYVLAQGLCEDVMSSGYSLEGNFKDIFYNELNNEIIFAIEYIGDVVDDSQNFSSEWLNSVGRTSGVNYVTADVREALDAMGGNRTMYSYRQDATQTEQYQVVKYLPNGDESLGILPTSSDPTKAGNDWIVLRYADVLLMHVEAIMAGASETSNSAAISSFMEVRDRAGITDNVTTITKVDLLNERRVEFAFENQRFFDLVRLGMAEEVLSAFSTETGGSFSSTDLLLPIPQREINLSNGLLTQNPGY